MIRSVVGVGSIGDVTGVNAMMNCPKCNGQMQSLTVAEQTVDRCTTCAGLWFDLREHERIAESGTADVQRVDSGNADQGSKLNLKRDVSCPICKVKMLRLSVPNQHHIQYESCPVCHGTYFDAGEFKDYASRTLAEQVGAFLRGFRRRPTK